MNFTRSGISAPCFFCIGIVAFRAFCIVGVVCILFCAERFCWCCVVCWNVAFEACCKKYLKNILQKFAD